MFDNKKNEIFSNEKELLMYFQSSIRNVALTTAVSFAALGYSRFYRGKSKLYSSGMTFVSFLIILCSTLLNLFLFNSIQEYLNNNKEIDRLSIINKIFIVIHSILIFFALYTFIRLMYNKKFAK
tara:strand:- start:187 stop:558 length:372 start_codon:yes stop_codon:yes gene_type:complete